jgi:hypothetical protein
MRVIRAGFEPRRGRSTSAVWIDRRTITRWVWQPARMAQIRRDRTSEVVSLARAEIFALPDWVANTVMVTLRALGRSLSSRASIPAPGRKTVYGKALKRSPAVLKQYRRRSPR